MPRRQKQSSGEKLKILLQQNRRSRSGGVYSVCSAHPFVLEAAIRQAMESNAFFLVESTSSQVNQEGGYTGQAPHEFAKSILSTAKQAGLTADQILLGGDHLGPFPWRNQDASIAMEKAYELVRGCVLAGYQKIHLDASMPCADDAKNPLDAKVVAQRAAVLAEAAEAAFAELPGGSEPPVYVIGTEVPAPGGETEPGTPARSNNQRSRFGNAGKLFDPHLPERKLQAAWERVIALVVQPGVEFGDDVVLPYDRERPARFPRRFQQTRPSCTKPTPPTINLRRL